MSVDARRFDDERESLLRGRSRMLLLTGAALMPVFLILDFIVAPEWFFWFTLVRLSESAFLLFAALLLAKTRGLRAAFLISMVAALSGLLTVNVMCAYLGGAGSRYFFGTLLIVFAVLEFLPWTLFEALVFSALSLVCYFVPIIVLSPLPNQPEDLALSLFFLLGSHLFGMSAITVKLRDLRSSLEQRMLLEAARDEANREKELKERFFANVTHELRTPMNLVFGPIEQLRVGADPAQAELLDLAHRSMQRLLRQVNMLLDIAKQDAGELGLDAREGNIGTLVDGLAETARPLAENNGISLARFGLIDLPDSEFDPQQVEVIIANLLTNAIKFTPDRGSIMVSADYDEQAIRISVKDTGIGIASEDQDAIFERFQQSGQSVGVTGTGLGLSLARDLAVLHGGSISVESELGKGSTFQVSLPRIPEPPPERRRRQRRRADRIATHIKDAQTQSALSAQRQANVLLSELDRGRLDSPFIQPGQWAGPIDAPKLLIVEDDSEIRHYTASRLAAEYRVAVACNGREGLEVARANTPDVVLSDVNMPEMNGVEFVRALRSHPQFRQTAIVMLTAAVGTPDAVSALEAGADDYLRKPAEFEEVVARVRAQIRARTTEAVLDERTARLTAIGSMAGTVVHDIRNMLSALIARADWALIRFKDGGDELSEEFRSIQDTSFRAERMMQEILDFSRGAETSIRYTRMGLREFVDRVASALRGLFENNGIELAIEVGAEDSAPLDLDVDRVLRVVENLVVNAKHALNEDREQKSKKIWLAFAIRAEQLLITVNDNGPGVPDDIAGTLFEAGVSSRGSGLGLATVKSIVVAHAGQVTCSARGPFGGALFEIVIPQLRPTNDPQKNTLLSSLNTH
ncbi:MAG: ATP-binding protein [Myxococcota bacterium]